VCRVTLGWHKDQIAGNAGIVRNVGYSQLIDWCQPQHQQEFESTICESVGDAAQTKSCLLTLARSGAEIKGCDVPQTYGIYMSSNHPSQMCRSGLHIHYHCLGLDFFTVKCQRNVLAQLQRLIHKQAMRDCMFRRITIKALYISPVYLVMGLVDGSRSLHIVTTFKFRCKIASS
jgi:hypothetical protein